MTPEAILLDVLNRKKDNGYGLKITADQIRKIIIDGVDLTKDSTFKRNFGDASKYVMEFIKNNIKAIVINGAYFDEVRRQGPRIFRTGSVIKPGKRCKYWDWTSANSGKESAMGDDVISEFETFISRTLASTKKNEITIPGRPIKPGSIKMCTSSILRYDKSSHGHSSNCLIAYTTDDCENQEIAEVILHKINNI